MRSSVRAPADGLITNLKLSVGQFAQAGAPVMTFIDTRSIWLVAELREKSLGHVRPGADRRCVEAGYVAWLRRTRRWYIFTFG